jgi:uncharacterized spore protein YtfJ
MPDNQPTPNKIDRRLLGSPLDLGAQTVTPIARVFGYAGSGGSEGGTGGGGWLKITPVEVLVSREGGSEEILELASGADGVSLRGMAAFGLLVAAVGAALLLVLKLR